MTGSLRPFYADWAGYNRRWVDGIRRLTPEDLDLRVPADRGYPTEPWPIWAVIAHTVGPRVFWLCDVFGEPGAEQPRREVDGLGTHRLLPHQGVHRPPHLERDRAVPRRGVGD